MAGSGQRFIEAGYSAPKPLIPLNDGKRIIDHVVGMFNMSDEFVFVCNQQHLDETTMHDALNRVCPNKRIIGIPPHKLGPVWTCHAAFPYVANDEPVIVAYCDGAIRWDRAAFEAHVGDNRLDGCLLTHTGFHPHTLSTTRMAFCRTDGPLVLEVKEKASYTDDPASEHASSGVYYFARGGDLKTYGAKMIGDGAAFNGEYYATLLYNLMIDDGKRVGYFDTPGVAILGTPCEVSNYEAWATILRGGQVKSEVDALACWRYWRDYHAA